MSFAFGNKPEDGTQLPPDVPQAAGTRFNPPPLEGYQLTQVVPQQYGLPVALTELQRKKVGELFNRFGVGQDSNAWGSGRIRPDALTMTETTVEGIKYLVGAVLVELPGLMVCVLSNGESHS